MIEGVAVTPLKIIPGSSGDILHAIKKDEESFKSFGEAYFSTINKGDIKAWKRHRKMTLNLVVPAGEIKFVLFDERVGSSTSGEIFEITLSRDNYKRLTVPPMVWVGFTGLANDVNMILNIADIPHDPDEIERLEANKNHINYNWTGR